MSSYDCRIPEDHEATPEAPGVARETPEETALRRLRGGDISAFWQLWEYYRNDLERICGQHMSWNACDAEDALSGAMLKAYEKLPRHIAGIRNFPAWLRVLTRNHCLDILRRRGCAPESVPELGGECDSYCLEREYLDREMYERILQAMHELPPILRGVSLMHFIAGKNYNEIAGSLNITNDNTRKRVQKIRSILREKLAAYISSS